MNTARLRDLPISLDALRGFEAAARHLSFTAAARELFLTQSAVSRQVQQLEEQLGVKLFERRARTLALTVAGSAYYEAVDGALERLRAATRQLRARSDPVVRVTTTVTFAALWLVPRLGAFQTRHPEISVHVAADNGVRQIDALGLDLAIRYSPAALAGAGAERLFGERVAPVAAPAWLRRHPVREPADLAKLPLIDVDDPATAAAVWLSWKVWAETMQIRLPSKRGPAYSHYDQVVQAALAGQGIALGRFPLVDDFIADGRLKLVLPRRFATQAQRAYWLIQAERSRARPEVQAFVDWLRQEVARAVSARSLRSR